jgi:[ribosomal protein S5]-alanine N-acetyltransferase
MKYLLGGLESDRLLYRKVNLSDFNVWLEFHKNSETSKYWISEVEHPEIACRKWYENQFERYANDMGGMNALIDKQSNLLIGHCGLLIQEVDGVSELEVAYSLLPEFWNKGYATEAAKKCIDFAFDNSLSNSLISIISITNIPSQNVAMKIGMIADKMSVYNSNVVNIFRIQKG